MLDKENLKDFAEQIRKGNIEIIDKDVLIIENYPMGFKRGTMSFKKTFNRNGAIIERTSQFNGKISKPKKTTATLKNIFVFDKELKKHFIIDFTGRSYCVNTTNFFNANGIFKEYYFANVEPEYLQKPETEGGQVLLKKKQDFDTIQEFFKGVV